MLHPASLKAYRLLYRRSTPLPRDFRELYGVETVVFRLDGARPLRTVLNRTGLRFQMHYHEDGNTIEWIFRGL